jgi:beta-lactamase superfamily II metal-dependent hydrolase
VWTALAVAAGTLDVYFIDVEGGQATLFVSPSGETMLVDTGYAGLGGRDADRIAAAAKLAGVKQIDYLVITHYHADHVGGVAQLAERLPIKHFIDHGASFEKGTEPEARHRNYLAAVGNAPRTIAKPGTRIPVKGLDVQVVAGDGAVITKAVNGGGAPNPACASAQTIDDDKTENSHSLSMLITYGKFRLADLGDLTWNKELALACPNNLLGTVDVYLMTHHGSNGSGPAAIVRGLHPRVAIMNNGVIKGGTPAAWQAVHDSPGLEDLWQLHFATAAGKEHNSDEKLIANPDPDQAKDQGNWIKLSAESNGSFTVTNSRNKLTKAYKR